MMIKKVLRVLVVSLFAAPMVANAGTLYLSQDSNANGLYTLSTATGVATLVGAGITTVNGQTVGLSLGDSPSLLFGSAPFGLLRINKDGSGAVQTGATGIEGMEFVNGVLYGAINAQFFTVNTTTGAIATNLASPGVDVEGLAFGNGVIYGLQGSDVGGLYAYNIALDTWAFIGATGVAFDNVGLAFDSELGVLYATGDQDSNLYRINALTALATVIGSTGLNDPGGGLAFEVSQVSVPEPATLTLLGIALAGLGFSRRRKR